MLEEGTDGERAVTRLTDLQKFADALVRERDAVLTEWRRQVRSLPAARDLDEPTLTDHVPHLLDEMVIQLRSHTEETIPEALANMSGCSHGLQRVVDRYDIEEVVAEYNMLRGCLHDMGDRLGIRLQGAPFHVINRVMDGGIGAAVQAFAAQQARVVRRQREEYLSFVAHDLRTPLHAMAVSLAVLEGRGGVDPAPLLDILRRNVATLAGLVDKVLAENIGLLSDSVAAIERRTFELWPVVEEVLRELEPLAADAACHLSNAVPFGLAASGDVGLLRRVFRNLVGNAIRYSAAGRVEVGAISLSGDGAVECWVKDSGCGIPEDRLEVIFQRLETDPDGEGIGLGLAIVRSFVEAHGGEVTVESREGVGSTFRLLLPGRALESEAPASVRSAPRA